MLIRLVAGVLIAGSAVLLAQQPQVPVFRAGIDVVPVTVTVTDQQGRAVTGLKQSDFKVFEDGREREIVAFFPQLLGPGQRPPAEPQPRGVLAPATRRTFLIVLGHGFIQEPTKALDGAMTFVRNRLLPQDEVAIMVLHRATSFTTDHEAIARVIERYKREHIKIFDEILRFRRRTASPAGYGRGGPQIPDTLLADFDRRLFDGVQIRNAAELLFGMDLAARTGERPWQQQERLSDGLKYLDRIGVSLTDAVITSSRLKLYAAIEYLRFKDGDKHIVLLDRNMYPPIAWSADDARMVAARANDARVVVDYVWTYGTSARNSGCQPCRDVVERTGGSYTSVDYMDQALAKIDDRTRVSYLLGYTPVSTAFDGKYRQVRVEVNRPKVAVAFRRGYFATEAPTPLDVKELVRDARLDAAARYGGEATDITFEARASTSPGGDGGKGVSETVVDLKVDVSQVNFQSGDGLRTGSLEVSVYCGAANEAIVGELKVRWNLRADENTYADWVKNGLRRTVRVPVTAGPKFVKVILYDADAGKVGSKTITIATR